MGTDYSSYFRAEMEKDYFLILGLERGASENEVKRAYKKMALQFHPDKNKETGAEDMFKEVAEAYEILKQEAVQMKQTQKETQTQTQNSRRSESNYNRNTDPSFRTFFD